MNWEEMKGRLSKPAGVVSDWVAAPLHLAQLSPLSGMILAFLAATTLGAGLFAAYAFFGPKGMDAAVTAPDWTPPTLAVVELEPPKPPGADVQTLTRPIFSKNRRPAPKTEKAAGRPDAAAIPAATGLTVNAIVRNKKASQAYFVSPASPEGAWKKVGDTVDSWTIKSIERYEVFLVNGAQTVKVKLYTEDQAADPPAPPRPVMPSPQAD